MHRKSWCVCAGFLCLMTMLRPAIAAFAQTQEVKAKPAMYSFVAKWQFQRAAWPDAEEAALHEAIKAAPLSGEALTLDVDHSEHRDELYKTNCTYK